SGAPRRARATRRRRWRAPGSLVITEPWSEKALHGSAAPGLPGGRVGCQAQARPTQQRDVRVRVDLQRLRVAARGEVDEVSVGVVAAGRAAGERERRANQLIDRDLRELLRMLEPGDELGVQLV